MDPQGLRRFFVLICAQLEAPNRGWAFGENEYTGRFQSALSNYRTARKFGADFVLLPHDLWDAESIKANEISYPGDNGDWSNFDRFYDSLFSDLRANGMIDGVLFDIWNEPDGGGFWACPSSQYLDYWGRAYARIRAELGEVRITGPSLAVAPSTSHTPWTDWVSYVSQRNLIPDVYSWHQLNPAEDPEDNFQVFENFRRDNNLPQRPIDINECAAPQEQIPSTSVWYISRFERLNFRGLHANWAWYGQLHDFLANLLGKNGSSYFPNGKWQVYKYYAAMSGERVATSGAPDGGFDVFATKDNGKFKVLAGNRGNTNTYDITINSLTSVGLPDTGT